MTNRSVSFDLFLQTQPVLPFSYPLVTLTLIILRFLLCFLILISPLVKAGGRSISDRPPKDCYPVPGQVREVSGSGESGSLSHSLVRRASFRYERISVSFSRWQSRPVERRLRIHLGDYDQDGEAGRLAIDRVPPVEIPCRTSSLIGSGRSERSNGSGKVAVLQFGRFLRSVGQAKTACGWSGRGRFPIQLSKSEGGRAGRSAGRPVPVGVSGRRPGCLGYPSYIVNYTPPRPGCKQLIHIILGMFNVYTVLPGRAGAI